MKGEFIHMVCKMNMGTMGSFLCAFFLSLFRA